MDLEQIGAGLLSGLIRLAGALWVFGAVMIVRAIRVESTLDRSIQQIEAMTRAFEEGDAPPAPARSSEEDAWLDADDRLRRIWMGSQAALLFTTGVAMVVMSRWAAWLIAILIACQGGYFFWREYQRRHAPTAEAAVHVAPERSTVNAAWVSVFVGIGVWIARAAGMLS